MSVRFHYATRADAAQERTATDLIVLSPIYEHVYSSKYMSIDNQQTDRYIQIKRAQTYR